MDDISAVSGVPMLVIAVVVAAILIVFGRMIGRGVAAIFNLVNRYVSRATSSVITAIVVALVGWVLFSDVVSDGFRSWANRTFGAVDEGTAEGVEHPDSPTVSGSPDSLAAWDTLGFEGRSFVAAATDRDTIRRFQESIGNGDADVVDPIRVYAGIDSADDLDERADLVVDELERTDAFDREVLVVATTTGTGWIDPNSATALELMHGGDTAIASIQYSFLPSWIAFLVDEPVAAEAGAALFDAVYRRWAELPEDARPKLIVYGLSLGSFGAEAGFAGTLADSSIANLQARTDGVLLAGPTHDNPVRQQIAERARARQPRLAAGVRGRRGHALVQRRRRARRARPGWEAPRLVYVGHASDPVRAWSWSGLWRPPDWMDQPRGPDVPKGGPWVPFVTFTQSVFDLMAGFSAPPAMDTTTGRSGRARGRRSSPPTGGPRRTPTRCRRSWTRSTPRTTTRRDRDRHPLGRARHPSARRRTDAALLGLVIGLAIYNVVRSTVIDGDVDIATNLAVGAIVFVVGRRAGLSLTELGLDRARIRPGLRLGLLTAVVVTVVVTVGAAAFAASDDLDDARVDVSLPAMLLRVLVVIPLATAVVEEVIFRGVLHGLLRRRLEVRPAAACGAVLFGLWHVYPAWLDDERRG